MEFWAPIGITQSGGSRYETGRNIPNTVRLLLHMAYAPADRSQRMFAALRAWKSRKATPGPSR